MKQYLFLINTIILFTTLSSSADEQRRTERTHGISDNSGNQAEAPQEFSGTFKPLTPEELKARPVRDPDRFDFHFSILRDEKERKPNKISIGTINSQPAIQITNSESLSSTQLVRLSTSAKTLGDAQKQCENFAPQGEWTVPNDNFMKSTIEKYQSVRIDKTLLPFISLSKYKMDLSDLGAPHVELTDSSVNNEGYLMWAQGQQGQQGQGMTNSGGYLFEPVYSEREVSEVIVENFTPTQFIHNVEKVQRFVNDTEDYKSIINENFSRQAIALQDRVNQIKMGFFGTLSPDYRRSKEALEKVREERRSFPDNEVKLHALQNKLNYTEARINALEGFPVVCMRQLETSVVGRRTHRIGQ